MSSKIAVALFITKLFPERDVAEAVKGNQRQVNGAADERKARHQRGGDQSRRVAERPHVCVTVWVFSCVLWIRIVCATTEVPPPRSNQLILSYE